MTTMHADPIAILLDEHRAGEQQFQALDAALAACGSGDTETVRRALDTIRHVLAYLHTGLEAHIRKEEGPLFIPLKAAMPADDRLIEEMVAEHDQARLKRDDLRAVLDDLLGDHDDLRDERARLNDAVATLAVGPSPAALAALGQAGTAMLKTLRIHFQNEEEIVFPLAVQLLSPDVLADAGRAMLAIDAEGPETAGEAGNPPLIVHLRTEIASLRASAALAREGRTATTLVKDGPLRVLLVALSAGGRLREHTAPGPISIHVLSGRVQLHSAGQVHPLTAGDLASLPAGQVHEIQAHQYSLLVVTIAAC
jgi:quercetin dioxygenase-like cupin family protein/hemerythrin-like domain-containing protein